MILINISNTYSEILTIKPFKDPIVVVEVVNTVPKLIEPLKLPAIKLLGPTKKLLAVSKPDPP